LGTADAALDKSLASLDLPNTMNQEVDHDLSQEATT
jgi:hypothetical protein